MPLQVYNMGGHFTTFARAQYRPVQNVMNAEEIKANTNEIFRKVFSDSSIEIHDEMTAKDVEKWDSLTHLSMIAAVEEKFGVKFKLKELIGMKNVGDLLRLIETKQAG